MYLAGKISHHGWRDKIVCDIDAFTGEIYEKSYSNTRIDDLITSGPFFISCDHGCYHGSDSHGVGGYESGDEYGYRCAGYGIPKSIVPTICKKQIDRSNFVFAYIDSDSCYGTLCEIGYAIGKRHPVTIMFANDQLEKDMWFIAEISNIVFNKDGIVQKADVDDVSVFDASQKIKDLLMEVK